MKTSVTVWLMPIDRGHVAAAEAMLDVLSEEERGQAAAFVRDADRDAYVVAHVGLRVVLGVHLGLPAAQVALIREPCPLCGAAHGRPAVAAAPGPHFSLTHCTSLAACATAPVPVGLDVERRDRTGPVDSLHPGERAVIDGLSPHLRAEAALRCWVRKEAYLKGLGTGLGREPEAEETGPGPAYGVAEPTGLGGWTLTDVDVTAEHLGAIALRADRPVVHVRELEISHLVERTPLS
jgi:4'-phosphopantetheinyl transferase